MISRQLLILVLSLVTPLLIVSVALGDDQQKKQGKQQSQKVSTPSRAAPAPKVKPVCLPVPKPQQSTRPPGSQVKPGYQSPRPPTSKAGTLKPSVTQSHSTQPAKPVAKPSAVQPSKPVTKSPVPQPATPVTKTMPTHPTPQKEQKLAETVGTSKEAAEKKGKATSAKDKQENQKEPSKKELLKDLEQELGHKPDSKYDKMSSKELQKTLGALKESKSAPAKAESSTSASGKHQETGASSPVPPGAKGSGEQTDKKPEDKYKRDPKLANVKWSDNELRDHIKGNLDTLGEKYDKNKYGNMSRKDLEQAYSKIHSQAEKQEIKDKIKDKLKDLGEKYDPKKYDKLSQNELEKKYDGLKEKAISAKDSPHEKLENLSRKELTDAIAKEKGEPLNDHYKRMSKNELANELTSLKERSHQPTLQTNSSPHLQQPGQPVGASPTASGSAPAQAGSQQDLLKRRDELKTELLTKDKENVKEANKLRNEVDSLNKQIVDNEKGQALNTGAGLLTSIKNPFGLAGWAASNINQIGIQGGSLLSDKYLSGKQKEVVDNSIFKWRSATDIVAASTGDPTGSADAVLMAQRKYLEMKRDDDMARLNSLGQDSETRKLRDDYHNLLQQIGNK
jgi:hypothetical protein